MVGTLEMIALWLLVWLSVWIVATLSMVAVGLLTTFHVPFCIMVESLLFHEHSKSVNGVSCIFECVSQCVKVELPFWWHQAMESIFKTSFVWKEIVTT